MKDQISFMTGLFDTEPSVTAGDRRFGQDLAVWMALKSKGTEFVFGDPVKTASGWAGSVTTKGESFKLGFGLVNGIGSDYAEWAITIDRPRSWRSLRPSGSAGRSRLCDHIHNVLRDERQVRELHWD